MFCYFIFVRFLFQDLCLISPLGAQHDSCSLSPFNFHLPTTQHFRHAWDLSLFRGLHVLLLGGLNACLDQRDLQNTTFCLRLCKFSIALLPPRHLGQPDCSVKTLRLWGSKLQLNLVDFWTSNFTRPIVRLQPAGRTCTFSPTVAAPTLIGMTHCLCCL